MTNYQLSPSDSELRQILTMYLQTEISLSELKESLFDHISINFDEAPGRREIKDIRLNESVKLQVNNWHLCNVIKKYLNGDISSLELSNWAAFIYMTPFFIPQGETEEERWQNGEGVIWEVIQKLASPGIFGEINHTNVKKYKNMLSQNNST